MENKIINKPFTTNQIESTKPNIPRCNAILPAHIAGSLNAGHNRTIHYEPVMAGQKVRSYKLNINLQLLVPKTPAWQMLYITHRVYFVPNERVHKNYLKFLSQKTNEERIETLPNFGGKIFPRINNSVKDSNTNIQYTTLWRDSWISDYIPRKGHLESWETTDSNGQASIFAQPINALAARGRVAIYNDLERNKSYDEEVVEYDTDEVSDAEWISYMPSVQGNMDFFNMRAKKPNNYYTDYRTSLQGLENELNPDVFDNTANNYETFASWLSKADLARQNAENEQKTDWEILSELRGSPKLTEGRVQLIGERTQPLNYSAITQNTYNSNENIEEKFQIMGQQGAYSYTEQNLELFNFKEFVEDGFIHVISTIYAQNIFSTGINRKMLNIRAQDQYRPELIKDKLDLLYRGEIDNYETFASTESTYEVIGYKRRFNELFTMVNNVKGDMLNEGYYQYETQYDGYLASQIVQPNNTYQFFEDSIEFELVLVSSTFNTFTWVQKRIWKDYSDLQINKNQAIMNEVQSFSNSTANGIPYVELKGQNQIFYVGYCEMDCELPIDESIKHNYTQWGEV